jgi:cell cycle sensor histidine kinase DivJ
VADTSETDPVPLPAAEEVKDIASWHGAWLLGIVAAFFAVLLGLRGAGPVAVAGVAAMAVPGAAGLLLLRWDGRILRAALLALWAFSGALGCMLAGGVEGPLASWCLAPVVAAAVFGAPLLLAEAAALSLFAAAATAMVQLAGLLPAAPRPEAGFWLGLISLATTGLGLGAGLLLAIRRMSRRESERNDRDRDRDLGRRQAEAEVERVLNEQPQLVLAIGPDGRIALAYGYAPEGVPAGALFGADLADLAAPAERPAVREALQQALRTGWVELGFAPVLEPDRTCVISLRRGEDGRLYGVARDGTAERTRETELEAARIEAESSALGKSRFLANMSHELRTPLNAIMGFSDMMRSKVFGELQPRYAEYSELIHESGRHLLDLINDVLDMSKIEAERYQLQIETFDARDAVAGALRLTRVQADAAGVSLRGLMPPQVLEVDADRRAIKQIVLNLVSNGLKFTPRGGSVTVTAQQLAGEFELVVTDTGAGIAPEDLDRLGRPYEQAGDFTQRARGTGLGLSLVRAFAELHGGEMAIESTLGEGTSVTIRLPVLHTPSTDAPGGPPGTGAKIIAFNAQR